MRESRTPGAAVASSGASSGFTECHSSSCNLFSPRACPAANRINGAPPAVIALHVTPRNNGRPMTALATGVGLHVHNVHRAFDNGVVALDRFNLEIPPGQFLAILGPSGCGKSTLLRLIAALDVAQAGSIETERAGDVDPSQPPRRAYVFQDAHLLPWRTVLENVALPLELRHVPSLERRRAALLALENVGLTDAVNRYPAQLSGGMRMRVSLARAMVVEPELLLLDEPFAALDEITRQRLDEQLRELWRARRMTVLFVTHSTAEAIFLAERASCSAVGRGESLTIVGSSCPSIGRAHCGEPAILPDRRGRSSKRSNEEGSEMDGDSKTVSPSEPLPAPPVGAVLEYSSVPRHGALSLLVGQFLPPIVVLVVAVGLLELLVRALNIPIYLAPPPSAVAEAFWNNGAALFASLFWTGVASVTGFAASGLVGVALAILFSSSRWVRRAFYPYTIFFQTVPIVAIAPLLVFWLNAGLISVTVSAFIVSVFPVIANTLGGLLSTDPALVDLFRLYSAGRFATLWKLRLPSSLPNLFTGLRIAAGLAVIGSVVSEFLVGELNGRSGLGIQIVSGIKYGHTDVVFAAVLLASLLGLALFGAVNLAGAMLMRTWQASAD